MRRRPSSGQSLAEFAIVIPVLALVTLMAVDFGRVYLGWINLTNVAQIGANFAAMNPDAWQGGGDAALQLRYRQLMARDAAGINCTLVTPLPDPAFLDGTYTVGSRVKVEIDCGFPLVTPLIDRGLDILGMRFGGIGDADGNVHVRSSAIYTVRFGSPNGAPIGGDVPAPSPTPSPAPTAAPTSSPTPDPSAGPTPTINPVVVSFYGEPTGSDAYGGGPPGSENENQIVGIPYLTVTFYNTTVGDQGLCRWTFGDGGEESNACAPMVSHTYYNRGTYSVTLSVDGYPGTRANYVFIGCKVPAFAGIRVGSAATAWQNAGFAWDHLNAQSGSGNYKIGYQSLAGGLVNPPGGCAGATITVGP